MGINSEFWRGKKVLVTGHTGFKGSWLSLWLLSLGANVIGYALSPPTTPSLFEKADVSNGMISILGDICKLQNVKQVFVEHQPEIVIHMAAQSLVRHSYINPIETYETNVMGSLNILEGVREVNSVRAVIMVTTDKCYENREWLWAYRENEPMGGHDPYSSSKGCAELLISSYRNSFFSDGEFDQHNTAIASVRAGNVIGGGDWADDRLIPDIIRSFQNDETVRIRNPNAIRPWQHVLEPLSGYLMLAEKLFSSGHKYAEAWNFGPQEEDTKPVQWIVDKMVKLWGKGAGWRADNGEHIHEANNLKLDCSKAHNRLGWWPRWDLERALNKIIEWHKAEQINGDMRQICHQQIDEYMNTSNYIS